MATSRTATSKKPAAKTASSAPAKKTIAVKPAIEPKIVTRKAASTPAKKTAAAPVKKPAATPVKKASAPKVEKPVATAKNSPRKVEKKITASPEERYHMIATAAYFLAERHGFNSCYAVRDWIAAEAEIDAKLNA